MQRRQALRVMALIGVATGLAAQPAARASPRGPKNTLPDPDLLNPEAPWPLVLTADERSLLATLVDVILPADTRSPAASDLGAVDFIDEWVSAPYPDQQADALVVRDGLPWFRDAARQRFALAFADLSDAQLEQIADDVCSLEDVQATHQAGARCFAKVRDLTAAAVWSTPEGMTDLGFIGNQPLPEWLPPPAVVLVKLGLDVADSDLEIK